MAFDPRYSDAISGIESGGRYGLLGPVIKSGQYAGDRAYGKYQVMGGNIPQWTAQYYGQPLTPQQFLASPQAQDAVFKGEFGRLSDKYGPEAASRAWFAGEGGMNDLTRHDQLGTTVGQYGQKFAAGLGPSYAAVNSPPLTPGTQAPPLPPPINIGGSQAAPQSPLMASAPAQQRPFNPFGLASAASALDGGTQGMQAPPQLAQNPIQMMAMLQSPPNTQGLQKLLQNQPALRGLLS